ncbi:MAG: hypothetical protein ACKJSG_13715 [Lentisphaeria bacterium]
MTLTGNSFTVEVRRDLGLEVRDCSDQVVWNSSAGTPPCIVLADGSRLGLGAADQRESCDFEQDGFCGTRITLKEYPGYDAVLELIVAIAADEDTLLVQVEQVDGTPIREVEHLYRFEKPVADGGYLVVPCGSGYLIPADCADALPGIRNFNHYIGGGWSMPWFGIVRGADAVCVTVEDWWDCKVTAGHEPGIHSSLDFRWAASLGNLAYPRRQLIHFAKDLDYTGMAKRYREHARKQGLVRSLEDKAKETPTVARYVDSLLVRWNRWDPEHKEQATADLERFRELGFDVMYFFPKCPGEYIPATDSYGLSIWQAYLQPNPDPEWIAYAREMRERGYLTQGFISMIVQNEGATGYDPDLFALDADGSRNQWRLTMARDVERNRDVLDAIKKHKIEFDVFYYDAYSANCGGVEDFSPDHPCTMRQCFETMNQALADARREGLMVTGELARFYCMGVCDGFFFTDWAGDRLTNGNVHQASCGDHGPVGEPVPLFELVFHECFVAGFSGGGYADSQPGFDWWRDRTPRLYEMMFGSAPAFNWLPTCNLPVEDWDGPEAQARFAWLKRWNIWYKAIARSEMISHEFLNDERTQQRVAFANGVTAEFDMAADLCRVTGVDGFSGDWETPAGELGWYPVVEGEFEGIDWIPDA